MAQIQDEYKTLEQALSNTYRVDELKALAAKISKKNPMRKAELVTHITSTVFKGLDKILAKLDSAKINALAEAVHNWDGCFKRREFHAKYSTLPEVESSRAGMDILFLFFINGNIPLDLRGVLKKKIKVPPSEHLNYGELDKSEGLTVKETANPACMNLNTLLTMVENNEIRVSPKTGRATAATIKKISAILYDGDFYEDEDELDPLQAFAWPLLLQGGGLATIEGNFLKLTRSGIAALKKNLAQGIKAIWKKWEKTKIIDEFSTVTAIKGQKAAKGRTMTSPDRRRPVINQALTCLEPNRWITVNELARFMLSESYNFEMINYDWKLYFSDPNYGLLDYSDTWPLLQLRYILIYLFQYCATLGILDVSYKHPENVRPEFKSCWGADDEPFLSQCDGLMQIRLNDLGAFVLGLSPEYGTVKAHDFKINDTSIIFTGKGTPSPDFVLYLDKIAEQKKADTWDVSLMSLLNALKSGEKLKDIRDFIHQIILSPLGEPLEKLLQTAGERSSAIVEKGKVTLLECRGQIRKQILNDEKMSRLFLPAGKHHLVILPEKDEPFARHLEQMGIIIGG